MERKNKSICSISAVVPAYNEASTILPVLQEISCLEPVTEILVVCDGCTDDTADRVYSWGGANLLIFPVNRGKTQAVLSAARQAKNELILLCDADLINLKAEDLTRMIDKYREGYAMVIMEIGSQPWFFRKFLKSQPAVSGTRMLSKDHLLNIEFLESDRYKLEVRINDHFIRRGLSIAVSSAPKVHDSRKFKKYPFLEGLFLDLGCAAEVLASDGLARMIKILRDFRKIAALI